MDGYCVLEKQRTFDSCFLSLSELVFCFQYNLMRKSLVLNWSTIHFFFYLFKWMRKMKKKSQLIPLKKKKFTQFLYVAYLQALFFWLLKIYIIIFRVSKRFFSFSAVGRTKNWLQFCFIHAEFQFFSSSFFQPKYFWSFVILLLYSPLICSE